MHLSAEPQPAAAPPLAVVTGASSGIGAQLAPRLATRGFQLVLIGRRVAALREVAAQCQGEPITLAMDLAREAAVEPLGEVLETHGPARLVVSSAGAGMYEPFLEQLPTLERAMMQLHYHAVADLLRLTLPGMVRAGRGQVVAVTSMSTKMGPWGHAGYSASKAALICLIQTLAAEHRGDGLRFSYVNPGIIRTPYFDHPETRRLWERVKNYAVEPAAVVDAIERLLDKPRLEVCVPRSYRMLDLIKAISPDWASRIVTRKSRPE